MADKEENQQNQQTPGLDCPECGHRIPTSIPILLSGRPLFCGGCGLKLEIDMQKSSYVLDKLQDLQDNLIKAENLAKQATDPKG